MPDTLQTLADEMFASAGSVLGALAGRSVSAGASERTASDASIRIDADAVATVTRIPSADVVFVARYRKRDVGRIVDLMLGSPGNGGDLDAMQLSIVAETVAQISSAMGEALATATSHAVTDIESAVAADASAFPAPPFAAFTAPLDLGDGFTTTLTLDFDILAQHRLAPDASIPTPQPAPVLHATPAAAPKRRVEEGRPVTFAPMQPTPVRTAAPGHANLDLVHDVPLEISAVLGQTELSLREVVSMTTGSVFELDKLSTEPIDLYVNNILIARGEVVVVDDKFAVKISELNPVVDRV
ncbi:MAG TPA: flagellar motor switch protein FliN [Gaiellaceae bacterium]|nr:flagellar motor switch protein FliN [Gaiellaceae bacterium]HEV2738591.1 flagellar motor switch protein FliN [Candidatus Elarobacter sp.]